MWKGKLESVDIDGQRIIKKKRRADMVVEGLDKVGKLLLRLFEGSGCCVDRSRLHDFSSE